MKIAIVGVGALGSVYALRLSRVAPVTLVVRDLSRAPSVIHGERINGPAPHGDSLNAPASSLDVPADHDVVLLAVRADQLSDELVARLAADGPADRIVVALVPLLPAAKQRLSAALGDRLVIAMPGVIAYEPDPEATPGERRVRYWVPRAAPTTLDERPQGDPRRAKIHALAEAMRAAGVPAEVAPKVWSTNAATTIAFFPMLTGIAAAGGSIDRMLADDRMMKLGLAASKESRALAKTVGDLPGWASVFFSFVGPFTVRAGIKLGKSRAPEAFTYLEKHFGSKLKAQNAAIFAEIERLAAERGMKIEALREIVRAAS